jgi:hypothetical protein
MICVREFAKVAADSAMWRSCSAAQSRLGLYLCDLLRFSYHHDVAHRSCCLRRALHIAQHCPFTCNGPTSQTCPSTPAKRWHAMRTAQLLLITCHIFLLTIVAASDITSFTDAKCTRSWRALDTVNGYPDGLCKPLNVTRGQSFQVQELDRGCAGMSQMRSSWIGS